MSFEESTEPTAYAVICPAHGRVYLTQAEYSRQMDQPDSLWKCPRWEYDAATKEGDPARVGPCGEPSEFDDDTHEAAMDHRRWG